MLLFQEALVGGQTSEPFHVISDCTVTFLAVGTLSTVSFKIQGSPDGTNYVDLYQEDNLVALTATNNIYSMEVGGGMWFRVVAGAGTVDVDLWVSGHGVYV
jgi:hypothetical protein